MERDAINKRKNIIEIISNEELNNTEKTEYLKPLKHVLQEKLDLIKWLDEQTLELEESAEGIEECL